MSPKRGAGVARPAPLRSSRGYAMRAIAAVAVALATCGPAADATPEPKSRAVGEPSSRTRVTAPPPPATPVPTPTEADTSVASAARPSLPPGFPVVPGAGQLPLPPDDSTLIAAWQRDGFGREVYEFYAAALPGAGYPITLLGPGGGAAIIRFEAAPGVVWQLDMYGDLETTFIELRPERP